MGDVVLRPVPRADAIEYFRSKGFKITFDYRDMDAQEHQAAFTVAKAMTIDLLEDIRQAVDAALENGESLGSFKNRLIPVLQEKGWWGQSLMRDPQTQEIKPVQLGSPRRLRTIYTTNIRRAHAEGQWDRIQETKDDLPYLQYDGNNSAQPREQHGAWDGMVLPAEDPFWESHFPPRGYNCKCRVIQLSDGMVKRRGLTVSPSPKISMVTHINKRTGEVMEVPEGVHPAFNFKMGQGRAKLNESLVQKLNLAEPRDARGVVSEIVNSQAFRQWHDRIPASTRHGASQIFFPIAVLPKAGQELLGSKAHAVSLSDWTIGKQKANHPDIAAADYQHVQRVLDQGMALQDAERTATYILNEPGGFVAVVKAIASGNEVFLSSFRRLSRDEAERDRAVRRLLRKAEKK